MYFASQRKKKQEQADLQGGDYPEASVRQYLNIRRVSRDKLCFGTFCFCMFVILLIGGVGLFYSHFTSIGTLIDYSGNPCNASLYYNQSAFNCTQNKIRYCNASQLCPSNNCIRNGTKYLFILKSVCIQSNYTPNVQMENQIQIYNLYTTIGQMAYVNIGLLVGFIFITISLIWIRKLIYLYIFVLFAILLGFSFYLLKTTKNHQESLLQQGYNSGSYLLSSQTNIIGLSFTLLGAYLFIFPVVLFVPKKISLFVKLVASLYDFYSNLFTIVVLSVILSIVSAIVLFIIAIIYMIFYTSGSTTTSQANFFYTYSGVALSHPAVLALFFFGVYWLFSTFLSWHRYIISSAILQWYFEDGGKMKPVRKGLKRAWYHIGSASIDALITPFQWILLLLYSITKKQNQDQEDSHEDSVCINNCLYSLNKSISKAYFRYNRLAPVSGALTNLAYVQSCQLAANVLSQKNNKFFNLGNVLSLLFSIFSALIFVSVNYLSTYYNYSDGIYPAVTSLTLPVIISIFLGLIEGNLLSNMFTCGVDSLIFCFLMQKRQGVSLCDLQVKKVLQQLYTLEQTEQKMEQMYQIKYDDQQE